MDERMFQILREDIRTVRETVDVRCTRIEQKQDVMNGKVARHDAAISYLRWILGGVTAAGTAAASWLGLR